MHSGHRSKRERKKLAMRVSAAVLLTRSSLSSPGASAEIFLAKRSPDLRFFGGFWALPGGVVEECDRLGSKEAGEASGMEAALRRCAIRELFEETGVLAFESEEFSRDAVRRALLDRGRADELPPDWNRIVAATGEPGGGLAKICQMTTPPFSPVRYQAVYYQMGLPPGEEPTILPGELVEGRFWRVEEVLDLWARGELWIVPPVIFLLERLRNEESLEAGLNRVREEAGKLEAGKLHPVRFTPGVVVTPLRSPTHPPATTTNCVLIGTDSIYVLDPAATEEEERERLFEAIDERRNVGGELGGVLVSHHHPDHVGSVASVALRYRVPIYGHPLTLSRLDGRGAELRSLGDGETLDLGRSPRPQDAGRWSLETLHTPGHAKGHLVFVESAYRSVMAGDLVSTVSTIMIDPPEGHLSTYLESLNRVLETDIGLLYPAHGMAHREGKKVLRTYLRHRRMREERLVSALKGGAAMSLEDLLRKVYDDVDPRAFHLAERSLVAGLQKLEEENVASCRDGAWRLS